jgi:glycosyltransferase involved in cell wall biosynthesis
MKILHINTSDLAGGAARAAYRLHCGLRELGHDSQMLVDRKISDDPSVKQYYGPSAISSRFYRKRRRTKISNALKAYDSSRPTDIERLFNDDRSAHGYLLNADIPDCDVINLHWVSTFLDVPETLPYLACNVPVVWTLHDMNTMTGGCHYDQGCGRYTKQCGKCPQLGSNNTDDLSHEIFQRKEKVFADLDDAKLNIVTPSRWLSSCAEMSPLLQRFPRHVIPYGLDTDVFAPRAQAEARDVLGLPENAKILLFVADWTSSPRKGFQYVPDAISILNDENVMCVTVGPGNQNSDQSGWRPKSLGSIKNDRFLSLIYSAADLLVCPSVQDNLPNTVVESISCGTPCVAFNIGGMPDMIEEGVTGWLASSVDSESLAKAIEHGLEKVWPRNHETVDECSQVARAKYKLKQQAEDYSNLYQKLLNARV